MIENGEQFHQAKDVISILLQQLNQINSIILM